MTAPTPDLPTRDEVAAEVKRVTHAWSGPSMDEFLNDPPNRKQLAIADAVLALVADTLAAVTAERDQWKRQSEKAAEWWRSENLERKRVENERDQARQMLADAPHDRTCGSHPMNGVSDHGCSCWKAGL